MNKYKEEILFHLAKSIEFVHTLDGLPEEKWRKEIAKGKWTVAEVVGHLIPWDQFLLNERLPFLFTNENLPPAPHEDELNEKAASHSRTSSRKEIIDQFISLRQQLQMAIMDIHDDLWANEIVLGKNRMTIYDYLSGFAQHDEHHFKQIENII